jgi:hypothetical protein
MIDTHIHIEKGNMYNIFKNKGVNICTASDAHKPEDTGKYLKLYLSSEDWDTLEKTYPNLREENIWTSLFIMCGMFREKAKIVADYFEYDYQIYEDKYVTTYLEHVKQLPKNVRTIY